MINYKMNISLIVLSLKYVNDKYALVSNISKWIYNELINHNLNSEKLIKITIKKDLKLLRSLLFRISKNT